MRRKPNTNMEMWKNLQIRNLADFQKFGRSGKYANTLRGVLSPTARVPKKRVIYIICNNRSNFQKGAQNESKTNRKRTKRVL